MTLEARGANTVYYFWAGTTYLAHPPPQHRASKNPMSWGAVARRPGSTVRNLELAEAEPDPISTPGHVKDKAWDPSGRPLQAGV